MKEIKESANMIAFSASYAEAVEKEYITAEVNGYIEYVIIKNNRSVSVEISPQICPEFNLFHSQSLSPGEHLLPIRIQEIANTGERINYSSCKFLSNGPLIFKFKMPADTQIEVRVVYA